MVNKMIDSIIIKGKITDVFNLWADIENFPTFMRGVTYVGRLSHKASRWVIEGPLGKELQWEAVLTEFEPPKRVGWKSAPGDFQTSGEVTFNDLNPDETQLTIIFQYVPPAGMAGDATAHTFGSPEQFLHDNLRRFKEYVESPERAVLI